MKSSFVLPLLLLVALPLAGLAWLGARMVDGERARVREGLAQVMEERLAEMNTVISQALQATERELSQALTLDDESTDSLREISRNQRLIQQVVLFTADGQRRHPSMKLEEQSNEEAAFMERTASLWQSGVRLGSTVNESGTAPDQGWQAWFHGNGPHYLYWHRLVSGNVLAAEIPTASLLAEVIAKLPASQSSDASGFQLTDPEGTSWYEWGTPPAQSLTKRAPLPAPLSAWSLSVQMADVVGHSASPWNLQLILGLATAAIVMGLIAWHLYRESSREMRLAGQRVSFVNQVSHELKTPLTNISLYAELAEQRLPEDADAARECLQVVTTESARLSRLISNVLTFSKHQRGSLQPRLAEVNLQELLSGIVEQFRPVLAAKGHRLNADLSISRTVRTDADMVGQIIGNLLSNVEKYAGAGGEVILCAKQSPAASLISVRDHGPGIPAVHQERIFDAFYRVSDNLSDGHSGTGLGLSIARDLARSLGGDLRCETPLGSGALFILTLPNP